MGGTPETRVEEAIASIRAALSERGLLLLHDANLPSVTTLVAGEPIAGSWWGHEEGDVIWQALQVIDEEVATAKLVTGKVTLLHPRLWGALAAVGGEGAAWQWEGLGDDERALMREIEQEERLRSDEALDRKEGAARKEVKRAIDRLEKRLLVYTEQIHTESGKHARVLTSWPRFVADRALEPPPAIHGRAELEACVASWQAPRGRRLLPW